MASLQNSPVLLELHATPTSPSSSRVVHFMRHNRSPSPLSPLANYLGQLLCNRSASIIDDGTHRSNDHGEQGHQVSASTSPATLSPDCPPSTSSSDHQCISALPQDPNGFEQKSHCLPIRKVIVYAWSSFLKVLVVFFDRCNGGSP